MKFELTDGPHQMKDRCIELENPDPEVAQELKRRIMNNWTKSPDYIHLRPASPFIQSDWPDYLLIEFWGPEEAIKVAIEYLTTVMR